MENKKEKVYLTTISIECGIITLVDTNGAIVQYRQRGITDIDEDKKRILISMGMLARNWCMFPELPSLTELYYEDAVILGIARKTYPSEIINAIEVTPQLWKKYVKK